MSCVSPSPVVKQRTRSARARSGSSTSLPPTILITKADEMEDFSNQDRDHVHQLNVDYIDRRSGSYRTDNVGYQVHKDRIADITAKKGIEYEDANESEGGSINDGGTQSYTPHMQEKLQRKLKFYFMNPIEKWRARGRIPWKFSIQIFKLIIVTVQLVIFAKYISEHVTRIEDIKLTLKHLLLKGWTSDRDLKTYPPSTSIYAVFTKKQFHEHVDHVVRQFGILEEATITPFSYDNPKGELTSMNFCKSFYKHGEVWAFNGSFNFDSTPMIDCIEIEPNYINSSFNSNSYLKENNFSVNFFRLKEARLKFNIKSVFLKSLKPWDLPDCYTFKITVKYENENHDGLIAIDMEAVILKNICHGNIQYADKSLEEKVIDDLIIAVAIFMCILSLILCTRAIYRAYQLQLETTNFFKKCLNKKLPISDRTEFLNLWYVTIIISDLFIIIGSIFKVLISHNFISKYSQFYVSCTMLLGIGNLLMWSGLLRYFGFFPKYNILILTLKNSIPDILRYMFCVMFLYCGYSMCGWLVLGPYHYKFRSLVRTSQCLFSLINGDDMFATFQMVSNDANMAINVFSQIYLYSFIVLFIYVVLSLFIAVILESYELIKEYYSNGFPQSMLMQFIAQCNDSVSSSVYRQDIETVGFKRKFLNFIKCRSEITDDSYEQIIGATDY